MRRPTNVPRNSVTPAEPVFILLVSGQLYSYYEYSSAHCGRSVIRAERGRNYYCTLQTILQLSRRGDGVRGRGLGSVIREGIRSKALVSGRRSLLYKARHSGDEAAALDGKGAPARTGSRHWGLAPMHDPPTHLSPITKNHKANAKFFKLKNAAKLFACLRVVSICRLYVWYSVRRIHQF